jgi:hypothetical protein
MLEKKQKIILTGEDALEALANIEFILISLHKMGSYYSDKPVKEYQKLQPSSLTMIHHSATNPRSKNHQQKICPNSW